MHDYILGRKQIAATKAHPSLAMKTNTIPAKQKHIN